MILETSVRVAPINKCDICQDVYAIYYDTQWYIHYCSETCLNEFIHGYNREIDEIAIEVKTVKELFDEGEDNGM